jgi:hypothetical protein
MYKLSSSYSNDKEWRELDYWDSGKAIKLFNLTLGKLVKQCICDRDKLLQNIIEDADKVETIIKDWNNDCTTQLTARQERRIVTQCLYLRKAYGIAVLCMNAWTWKECCAEAIKSLRDRGIPSPSNRRKSKRGLGKPRRMLQILWGCGWIGSIKIVTVRSMRYSKDGRKIEGGELAICMFLPFATMYQLQR